MKKQYLLGFLLLLTSTIGMMPSSVFANDFKSHHQQLNAPKVTPKEPPAISRTSQRRSLSDPKIPQGAPEVPPEIPLTAQGTPQEPSSDPQEPPKDALESPEDPQGCPERLQGARRATKDAPGKPEGPK